MKIVFLSRYQDTLNRGAEVFVTEISRRLTNRHQVEVLSGSDSDSFSKMFSGNYDIIIPINGRMQSLKASLGRLLKGYKLVISGQSGRGWDDIWNIAVVHPDAFVALTEYNRKWAKNWAWRTKVVKIPNGVDLSIFKHDEASLKIDLAKPIILTVGALITGKHHERVIKAVAKLGFASLVIAGEGDRKKELEELGQRLLPGKFKILSLPHGEMPRLYRSVDLFTLPSWDREAFGIVYVEAMASGLGVVAPNDEVRKEIIGEAGILVDAYNIEKYAEALQQALKIDWTTKARKQAEKFSWDKIALEYEKLFKSL